MIKNISDLALSAILPVSCCFSHASLTSAEVSMSSAFAQLHWVAGDISESPRLKAAADPDGFIEPTFNRDTPHSTLSWIHLHSLTTPGLCRGCCLHVQYSTNDQDFREKSIKPGNFQNSSKKLLHVDVYHGRKKYLFTTSIKPWL